jgi:hypothetical protein
MQPFERLEISKDREDQLGTDEVWANDHYQVIVYRDPAKAPELPDASSGWPNMIWLSIKRTDQEPIHDWRELQEIKNMLVGRENEALEVYPAESRLVDTANQFHLWVFSDPKIKLPFGFFTRAVADPEMAKRYGGKQRPFNS